jgi:hypothetical protein
MIPMPGSRGGKTRLSRTIRRKVITASDPLLTDENAQRNRRARPSFGDTYNAPIAVNSTYQPPEPIGIDAPSTQQTNVFDDFLLFHDAPPSRSLRRRRRRLHHDNPAVDMGVDVCSHGCCCMQCVRTQEIGFVENFGKFQEILAPGFYCLPWPLTDIVGRLSLRIQQLDVVCETKTKDNGV